ncbi:MAG: 5'-deoxynucleotidase [Saccharofermentans sp.]|nr:5'-deoxynucleotidase [Saccharofermentans sp.]
MEEYGFYAMLDRMQYIIRWGMMRNSRTENIKEHSFDVAVIAHALCLIHNKTNPGSPVDEYKVMAYALYHDCTEIITGDLPTPIKYHNREITKAYKEVEQEAAEALVSLLPEDEGLRQQYLELLDPSLDTEDKVFVHKLVKAADKIAAYIKCVREESSGSIEFKAAKESTGKSIAAMQLPEADYFMEHYVPPYGYTLDKLTGAGDD